MKSIARLKDEARRHEQAEDWAKAIDAYTQVIALGDQPDGDGERELPLFNRIGDLFVRLGKPADAVGYYEDAADRYAEAGLYNNAIALCNKALRHVPGRVSLFRKLGHFSAAQGFLSDARRWFLDYAEAKFRQGEEDDAFAALGELASLSNDPEMRLLLARRLHTRERTAEAVLEMTRAYAMYLSTGVSEQAEAVRAEILALDPDADPDTALAIAAAAAAAADEAAQAAADDAAGAAGDAAEAATVDANGIALEPTAIAGGGGGGVESDPLAGLESTAHAAPASPQAHGRLEGFEATGLGDDDGSSAADFDTPLPTDVAAAAALTPHAEFDLPLLDAEPAADEALHAGLAAAWQELEAGRHDAARATLDALHARLAGAGHYEDAVAAIDARIELDPDAVALHRQRVEYAQHARDRTLLNAAYTALADALARTGAAGHAAAVREQLRELEGAGLLGAGDGASDIRTAPAHETTAAAAEPDATGGAASAARTGAPDGGASRPEGGYVDLAAMLAEESKTETRFFVAEKEPTGDEDLDFAELLAQFKTKLSESMDHEDAGSHYDLGLAFKDMGLLDEAIAEFQVALRAGDARLKIFEELGQCFFLKGQHGIALKVLQRALELRPADELELIGVYYYLGRAAEATGQRDAARDAYERVVALELNFQDVEQRLARL